jgi:hypothetical protein
MPRKISEASTRKEMIDPQLESAGWYLRDHSKVKIEIPVDGYDAEPWNGVSDYCLYRENGEVLAVVEAKRTSTEVRLAEAQLTYYITEIEKHQSFRPFGFLANGLEIHFVDVGLAPKREVFGFFTLADLENLLYIRQNAKPLSSIEINNTIVDRSYQHEAIRRVGEAFANGKRKALIVMATGTGKTRTTMGLIDVFMRSNQARRILFVADRNALVEKAKDDGFEKFIPNEPCTRVPRPIICCNLIGDCTGFMNTRLTPSGTSMPVSSMSTEMVMRGSSFFLNASTNVPRYSDLCVMTLVRFGNCGYISSKAACKRKACFCVIAKTMVLSGNCPDESFLHTSQISSHCLRNVSRLLTYLSNSVPS